MRSPIAVPPSCTCSRERQEWLFSQPARADVDATVVYGVNHQVLQASDRIVSNASCTTNGIVPVLKALDDALWR